MKLKKGDNVKIITGKDKGKSGKIVRALPKMNKVIVEGLNMAKKHQRPRKTGEKGTMMSVAMPIHVSNVKKAD
ncbi:MAG: 50S ribosomal protein L24 [Candidatus Paceibacterota bacterium]|jgi:large subunit ribosomal protein L24